MVWHILRAAVNVALDFVARFAASTAWRCAGARLYRSVAAVLADLLRLESLPLHVSLQVQLSYRSGGCSLHSMARRSRHAGLSI